MTAPKPHSAARQAEFRCGEWLATMADARRADPPKHRRWAALRRLSLVRFRLRSLMVAVTIFSLVVALLADRLRANRRETALRTRLHVAEKEKEIAQLEFLELRIQIEQEPGREADTRIVVPTGGDAR